MNQKDFHKILKTHKRVAIVGGPKTGKTTLSKTVKDRTVHHNDDGKHLPWEDQPSHWIKQATQDKFVIEGVHASRAIRKGLPVDAIIFLDKPHEKLSKGQEAMTKGQVKIFREAAEKCPTATVYRS